MEFSSSTTDWSLDSASIDERMHLFDNLQRLLEKQIEMVRKSDFRNVEALAEQADSIVEKIVKTKAFEQPEFDGQREYLTKLYRRLELILSAGKDSTGRQLRQVGNLRKTLKAYRNSS